MMMMTMPGNTNTNCPDVLPSFYYLRCRMYSHDRVAFLDEMAKNWRSRDILAVSVIFAAQRQNRLECGPMPNVMAALPNIVGALCSTPQSLADAHYYSAV